MNSTWALEDTKILVKGIVSTNVQGFNRIPWKLDITIVDSEDDENVWERLVTGEARLANSQFILMNAALLPAKLTANMATPFASFKNVNLTVDYEQSGDSATAITAELRINENLSEMTGSIDWPQDNTIPVSTQLTLNTPYDYEQLTLSWTSARAVAYWHNRSNASVSALVAVVDGVKYSLLFDNDFVVIRLFGIAFPSNFLFHFLIILVSRADVMIGFTALVQKLLDEQ